MLPVIDPTQTNIPTRQVNFAIIGAGTIATQFIKEAYNNPYVNIVGIMARSYDKTQNFANKYNIDKVYQNLDELLADTEVEAVYIATFHPTHFEYSRLCLQAGKHVLCEKPAALNVENLKKVIDIAKANKVLFMEALTVGFNPTYQEIKREIAHGAIGEVVHVTSTYGRVSQKKHKHNPQQAGGALYDIGVYNVFLLIDLLGIPDTISASMRDNEWGVDGGITALTTHANGVSGHMYATMDSLSGESARIIGTKGYIELNSPWTTTDGYTLHTADGSFKEYLNETDKWLFYEVNSFVHSICYEEAENEIMPFQKSVDLHTVIETIRHDLGLDYLETDRTTY